ncbi:alkaline shock response membrane anchor protein AmaP [Enterococcus faecalis]|uniref:alkaline shock response membrane anchor protein AmaP n=1 Tax=Enterococcus TaxID=1350 RepID=UPI001A96F7CC|nr:alkaline shock response membrane anchor protein AmaP [Enterococcus faecalis]MBO1126621.1 alkaline shock response membrane anchor protein AmaP [Enterococcus faecalis]
MTVFKKSIYILLLIILLPIPAYCLLGNKALSNLNIGNFDLSKFDFLQKYLSVYLFWASLITIILGILLMLIVLFFPEQKEEILFSKRNGQLKIKNKAIEQFIISMIEQEKWLKNPKISSKFVKNKLKVSVIGDFNQSIDLKEQSNLLNQRMTNELCHLLGITEEKYINIELRQYMNEQSKKVRVT